MSRLIAQGRERLAKAGEDDPAAPPAGDATVSAAGTPNGPAVAGLSSTALPDPYEASADDQLSDGEHADLAVCEAAVDNLRVAFWMAGKALQVIRDARLYREGYDTFEAYLAARWDMSRAQAYRLIDAWPLAELLSPIGDKINESQVRELLPLAAQHGPDAAVTVYRAIAEDGGRQVTAALLHGAVATLPTGPFDQAEAVRQILAYLQTGPTPPPQSAKADPVAQFTTVTTRLLQNLHKVADQGTLQAVAHDDPGAVRRLITEVRAVLDKIEQSAL